MAAARSGHAFIYYGNEIGQPQGPQRGDTRHRQPLDWAEVVKQREDSGSLWHWHRRLIQLRHGHASLRRGKARFLETAPASGVLALWREADGDRTLTVFSASSESLPEVTATLPQEAAGQPKAWLLGDGPLPAQDGRTLKLGPLAPFSTMVLRWEK